MINSHDFIHFLMLMSCVHLFTLSQHSSIASQTYQQGKVERTFPIFPFFPDFSPILADFLYSFPIFCNFFLFALCPIPMPTTPLSQHG